MRVETAQILGRYFETLRTHDWEGLAECLAEDVHRTGPTLDVVRGRQAYVEFLAGVVPGLPNYRLTVVSIHQIDDCSALALLTETLDVDGVSTEFPEALVFGFDDAGRIRRVDIYIQRPPPAGRG